MTLTELLLCGPNHKEGMKRAMSNATKHRERMTEILNSLDVLLGKRYCSISHTEVDPGDLWKDHMCSYATVTLDQGTIWMGRDGHAKGFSSMDDGGGLSVGFPVCSDDHGLCKEFMSSLNSPKNLLALTSHAVQEVKKASKDPMYPPMNGFLVTVMEGATSTGAGLTHREGASPWESILSDPLRGHMSSMLRDVFMGPMKGVPSCLRSLMSMDSGELSYIHGKKGKAPTSMGVRMRVQHSVSPRNPGEFLCVLATTEKGVKPRVFAMSGSPGLCRQEDFIYKFVQLGRECFCGPLESTKAVDVDTCRVSSSLSFHWMKLEGGREVGMSVLSMRHLGNRRDSIIGGQLRVHA